MVKRDLTQDTSKLFFHLSLLNTYSIEVVATER